MRSFDFYQVDAFSSIPFGGNPAAVLLIPPGEELTDGSRQKIAAENNLAETAFVQPVRSLEDSRASMHDAATVSLPAYLPMDQLPRQFRENSSCYANSQLSIDP